jgi:hypothetical protein
MAARATVRLTRTVDLSYRLASLLPDGNHEERAPPEVGALRALPEGGSVMESTGQG